MQNNLRLQKQVIEAQPGCRALTMLSASTLKAPTGWNNLGARVLLGCGPRPGMSKLWPGSRRGSTHSLFFGIFAQRALPPNLIAKLFRLHPVLALQWHSLQIVSRVCTVFLLLAPLTNPWPPLLPEVRRPRCR